MLLNPRGQKLEYVIDGHAPGDRDRTLQECCQRKLANSSYWSKGTLEANEARRGKSIYSHTVKCCSEAKKQASYPQNTDSKNSKARKHLALFNQ